MWGAIIPTKADRPAGGNDSTHHHRCGEKEQGPRRRHRNSPLLAAISVPVARRSSLRAFQTMTTVPPSATTGAICAGRCPCPPRRDHPSASERCDRSHPTKRCTGQRGSRSKRRSSSRHRRGAGWSTRVRAGVRSTSHRTRGFCSSAAATGRPSSISSFGVSERKGFIQITGEVGAGKSTHLPQGPRRASTRATPRR